MPVAIFVGPVGDAIVPSPTWRRAPPGQPNLKWPVFACTSKLLPGQAKIPARNDEVQPGSIMGVQERLRKARRDLQSCPPMIKHLILLSRHDATFPVEGFRVTPNLGASRVLRRIRAQTFDIARLCQLTQLQSPARNI